MRRSSYPTICLIATLAVTVSCASPETGWERLWQDRWEWHHRGWNWVLGVEAGGSKFQVDQGGLQLRSELLNTGDLPAHVEISGPQRSHHWDLQPGAPVNVEIGVDRGDYVVRAPPGVVVGSPRLGRPLARPRLLVFVLVDTLRADHVSDELTPRILQELAGGARWRQATANCSWTLPSMASMFTARPVLQLTSPEGDLIGIPDGMATWASQLDAAGLTGGAVVANYTVHALNGFASGFSSFKVPDGSTEGDHPDATWVVREAQRWLQSHQGEDAFLYLHLMDPHQPYRRHSGTGRPLPDLKPLALRQRKATVDEALELQAAYADEVRHVDEVLAPLMAKLPRDVVVVFTSDHGESLGEHQAWGHGLNLFQEALLVPLIISGPGVGTGDVNEPVQLLDLGPTVLGLMGVEPSPGMVGCSVLEGGSEQPLVSTTFGGGPLRWAWREGSDKVTLRMAAQQGLGVRARSAMEEGAPLPTGAFYFDLGEDPGETTSLPIPNELLARCGGVFAATAGRMVPGLQLVVWGERGAARRAVEISGPSDVIQAWGVARMSVDRSGDRLLFGCEDAHPLCAFAVRVGGNPEAMRVLGSTDLSIGLPVNEWVPVGSLKLPPSDLAVGTYVWWNPDRPLVVKAHDETLERLRALGYIE